MASINFRAVREMIKVTDVLSLIGWRARRVSRGGELKGKCPVHQSQSSTSTSFAAGPGGWMCHKCRRRGDALDLYAAVHGLNLFDAAVRMCNDFHVRIPWVAERRGARRSSGPGNGEGER